MPKALCAWGGWEGHTPAASMNLYVPWLQAGGFEVDVVNGSAVYADAERMAQYQLIVQCITMATIKPEEEQGLLAAVKAGAGLGGWHGGLADSFRQNTDYQWMVGGQWVAHPGGLIDYTVQIIVPDDPLTQGLPAEFPVHSEQYYLHVDPGNRVLATTTFSGEHAPWVAGTVMPVVWTRYYGQGRVFFCALGHQAPEFSAQPVARELVRRGLLWAGHAL
ncbi:MAG: ThuA domain-containing protein [Anaerolineales bacterium]|nr:ThuA domain-containing protein [Anaerolineales bacterium]